jgi:hypothetical protein
MKLHANAALSLKGRRELCRRVVEQGWTPRGRARAVGSFLGARFDSASH